MSPRLLPIFLALYAAGSVRRGDDVITYVLLAGIVVILGFSWALDTYDERRQKSRDTKRPI